MKQTTILMITLGFLIIAGCSTARYLLVEIDEVIHGRLFDRNWSTEPPAANGLSCYTCPFSSSGEDKCLTDGAELGESTECNNFQNACETLAIDDVTAPLRYNRRCARNVGGEDGCQEANIQLPDGELYPGRVCFCSTGDNCNTEV